MLRGAALVLPVAVLVWLASTVRLPDLPTLEARLVQYGFWSWAVFVGLYAVVSLTPVPVTLLALAGGVLFGVLEGTVLSVVGAMLGSIGAYRIARALGKKAVLGMLGPHAATVEEHLQDAGFLAVLTLRVAPGIPYWPVNYGAGALGVPFHVFVPAAALGSVPGQAALVALGAFVARPGVVHGVVLGVSWLAVLVCTLASLRRWRAARRAAAAQQAGDAPVAAAGSGA